MVEEQGESFYQDKKNNREKIPGTLEKMANYCWCRKREVAGSSFS